MKNYLIQPVVGDIALPDSHPAGKRSKFCKRKPTPINLKPSTAGARMTQATPGDGALYGCWQKGRYYPLKVCREIL